MRLLIAMDTPTLPWQGFPPNLSKIMIFLAVNKILLKAKICIMASSSINKILLPASFFYKFLLYSMTVKFHRLLIIAKCLDYKTLNC